ncbi:hypothetical protein B484DRAFT_403420 [Ochromonadaceae sp. CCMP2298]|nr:hypothetical protein B484DRAFT_403420 [Ochromonadaceae sp. CCMP2298]
MIGFKVVDDNKTLWLEVKALKDIIFEMAGGQDIIDSLNGRSGQKVGGRRAIADARNYSQLHYNKTKSSVDELFACPRFSLDSVGAQVLKIREGFAAEASELERDVDRLTAGLDGDVGDFLDTGMASLTLDESVKDMKVQGKAEAQRAEDKGVNFVKSGTHQVDKGEKVDKGGRKQKDDELCTLCGTKRTKRTKSVPNKGNPTLCLGCQTRKAKKEQEGARNMHTSQSAPVALKTSLSLAQGDMTEWEGQGREGQGQGRPHNNNDDSPEAKHTHLSSSSSGRISSSGGTPSKFRSRLDAARCDLHFLDDF